MQKIKFKNITLFIFAILLLSSCDDAKDTQDNIVIDEPLISKQAIGLNNQGVGEMGRFDYSAATVSFERLVQENPEWNLAKQNLAIALLNRQKPTDEDKAMEIAIKLSSDNNENLVAQYIVAILKFNQGLCEEALPRFKTIIELDKTDAYALYFAAQCHLQNGEVQASIDLYQKAIKADSYLRSAYYGSFMAAQRLGNTELAKQMLDAYQKLGSNPKASLAEIKYTKMGPKANAKAYLDNNTSVAKEDLLAPFFKSPTVLKLPENIKIQQFGIVNLAQTEKPQLYVVSDNKLDIFDTFLSKYSQLLHLSIQLEPGTHQLAWGDINNDNKIDVYITGNHDQLYIQREKGNNSVFEKIDMQSYGLAGLDSKAVRLSDADHDGDLDVLLLSNSGQFEIWNNNLNNTFTALSSQTTLPKDSDYNRIYINDIDSDRDVDIVLLSDKHVTTLLNDRMWDYEILTGLQSDSKILSLQFSNNDVNGLPEINLITEDKKISVYEFQKGTKNYKRINQVDDILTDDILLADINGNGQKEILQKSKEGLKISNNEGKLIEQIMLADVQQMKILNSSIGPELLALSHNKIFHVAASDNRWPYLLFNLSGKEDDANSVRSNYSGIGTNFTLRNQEFYAIGDSHQNTTGTDQDFQAIVLAGGNKKTIDYIALEWSDGVYQSELGLETGKYHMLIETQRQLSSCPVIFAWNNGKYEFISDVLGVGGIGFAVGRHEYGVPRPWENYLLTESQLTSENGLFKLQFTEPMEESAYLDKMQIQVLDVPQKWSVTLDERMQISEPVVTGKPLFYQSIINPIKVLNKSNQDVTEQALKTDKIAIEIENHDSRFLGLVDEQFISMEFDEELQGDYHLIMNGWVEYGYSQTMFAAWQAGKIAQAPTLEYKIDGQWKLLLKEFGYPAGMPRAATVPISIPEKTRFLRIRTNMEVYFDQLGLIQSEQPEAVLSYNLKLQSAKLKSLGFPRREDNKQRVPSYDFSKIQPFWDTRYMEGAYTQLGEITELLQNQDNALAIIGAGEGIELKFIDDLPKLKEGYKRFYLLKFVGWAKDMDILTKQGETLAPIPVNGVMTYKARLLNQKYNTRFQAGK